MVGATLPDPSPRCLLSPRSAQSRAEQSRAEHPASLLPLGRLQDDVPGVGGKEPESQVPTGSSAPRAAEQMETGCAGGGWGEAERAFTSVEHPALVRSEP